MTTLMTSLALVAAPLASQAATIVHEGTFFVVDTQQRQTSFTAPAAGPYKLTVFDKDNPNSPVFQPFDFIAFSVSQCTLCVNDAEGLLDGAQSASVGFDGNPVFYLIDFLGKVENGGIGQFGFEVALVPIPAPILLLGSAVLGLVVVRRRVAERAQAAS
jgi:hypothetical protein